MQNPKLTFTCRQRVTPSTFDKLRDYIKLMYPEFKDLNIEITASAELNHLVLEIEGIAPCC